jgi:hypothetical protein
MDISAETFNVWFQGFTIPLTGLASGDTFRVAFLYTGENAEKWYVEDLCITTDPLVSDPVCLWSYGFDDCSSLGTLTGTGWTNVAGSATVSTTAWRTSYDTYVTYPTSATIDYSGSYNEEYLVSADITIP